VRSARDAIHFDNEAQAVLDEFIRAGFGRFPLADYVRAD